VAIACAVIGVGAWTLADGPASQPPGEVWVPAAGAGPSGDRRLLDDVRVAPAGGELGGWRKVWVESAAHEPCLYVRPPVPLWYRTPVLTRTDCFRLRTGGFADSGERRDVNGTSWARFAWIDEQAMRRRAFGE
jgi:hypothetical protein